MENVFNFIPRTGFGTAGTICSFETGAMVRARVPATFLRDFMCGMVCLHFPFLD
jgi:hypothetical protein